MTPTEYIGHQAYRLSVSDRWPPDQGEVAYAKFLRHIDGTEVLFVRGVVRLRCEFVPDIEAHEAFGTLNVCHRCVADFCGGQLIPRTSYDSDYREMEFKVYWATTAARHTIKHGGRLCIHCVAELEKAAKDDYEAAINKIRRLSR